jgi:hypothetical protein
MICADFLAVANMESGNPDILANNLRRLFSLMPLEQQVLYIASLPAA